MQEDAGQQPTPRAAQSPATQPQQQQQQPGAPGLESSATQQQRQLDSEIMQLMGPAHSEVTRPEVTHPVVTHSEIMQVMGPAHCVDPITSGTTTAAAVTATMPVTAAVAVTPAGKAAGSGAAPAAAVQQVPDLDMRGLLHNEDSELMEPPSLSARSIGGLNSSRSGGGGDGGVSARMGSFVAAAAPLQMPAVAVKAFMAPLPAAPLLCPDGVTMDEVDEFIEQYS